MCVYVLNTYLHFIHGLVKFVQKIVQTRSVFSALNYFSIPRDLKYRKENVVNVQRPFAFIRSEF